MTKPYRVHIKYYEPLALVTTIKEAAEHWDRHRSTVRYAIDAENIAAVQSGKTWLISVPSLQAFWGNPPALFRTPPGFNSLPTPLHITHRKGFDEARYSINEREKETLCKQLRLLPSSLFSDAE